MSQPIGWRGGHLGFSIGPKTQTREGTLKSYCLSLVLLNSVHRFRNVSANQKPGQPLFFWKNTYLVKDVEILLLVMFPQLKNVSANQSPGPPFCFPISPKNRKLVVDADQRRHWRCVSQLENGAIIFVFRQRNEREDIKILLHVKFPWAPFNCYRGDVRNNSVNQRPKEKKKEIRLSPMTNPLYQQKIRKPKDNTQTPPKTIADRLRTVSWSNQTGNLVFQPEKHKLGRGIYIFLPVKFCWIAFSGLRETENASANQRLGGHLVLPIDQKNTDLVENV